MNCNDTDKLILLVEDEAIIALNEETIIKGFGFNVISVNSGEKAIKAVTENESISLVLMDINLGKGINGPEAAQKILEIRDLPIVFLTSHCEMEYVDMVKKITRYGYVTKNSGDFVLRTSIEMAFELHQSNLLIQENANALNRIFNLANDMVCIADINTSTFVKVNPSFTRILGYKEEELEGQSFLSLIHPDDLETTAKIVETNLQKGVEVISFVNRYRCKDGSYRYLDWNSHPVVSEGMTYAIARDITEQKKVVEELHKDKNFNETLLSASPDQIYVFDITSGKNIYSNGAIDNILEYDLAQIKAPTSQQTHTFVHDEDVNIYQNIVFPAYSTIQNGEFIEYEYRVKHKDGQWIHIHFKESVLKRFDDGKPSQIFGIAKDTSEIHKTQRALQMSESFIRTVMDNLPIGVAVNSVNPGVNFDYSNDNFAKFYCVNSNDLKEPDAFWDRVYEDPVYREKIKKRVLDDCASEDPARMIWEEIPITRKGKETRYITAMNTPIPRKQLMLSTVWDVTKQKQAEEKISGLLKEKEVLLKEVHHRIKNNLNSIKSLLRLQIRSVDLPETISALQDAICRLESMEVLYNKLYWTNHYEEISIREYISELIEAILNTFPENELITIETKLDDFSLQTEILLPFGIIINELLTNALKHAFNGSNKGTISISVTNKGKHIRFVFSDNGIGIPDTNNTEQTGFGLTLINLLVQQIDGTCSITSNTGTMFTIDFDK